jgi:hypothetical protein
MFHVADILLVAAIAIAVGPLYFPSALDWHWSSAQHRSVFILSLPALQLLLSSRRHL